jgi:hypothetical protein
MGRHRSFRLLPVLLTALGPLAAATAARAQMDQYEAKYGPVAEVSVDDLTQMPEAYRDRPVRTRGRLEMVPQASGGLAYALRGMFGGRVYVSPMAHIANEWEDEARAWVGREVEVSGLVGMGARSTTGAALVYISIWSYFGPPDEKPIKKDEAIETTLEDLVTKPGKLDGKAVRVRGQFRGQNLFGDLPSASRRRSDDWVIKDDMFAVWVTGKKPKGSGWVFDAGLKRDTGKWLQVIGRVRTVRDVVTIEASEVTLSKPPTPTAQAAPPSPPPPQPKKPPVVVFSLPLDGERDVPPNTVFKVQFSKDMEESSFAGRVVLRYAGRLQPGDRDLDAVKIGYDGGLRTLQIDPGDLLRPGRVVEILLLPGIVDLEGLALHARPGVDPGAVADMLRFQTAADLLGGSLP